MMARYRLMLTSSQRMALLDLIATVGSGLGPVEHRGYWDVRAGTVTTAADLLTLVMNAELAEEGDDEDGRAATR